MDKRCNYIGVVCILLAVLILSACGHNEIDAPELLVPISAQIRFDTAFVTRGQVAEIERRTGIVRVESRPLNFGAVTAFFETFYVRPGDTVIYDQVLARLDMEYLREQITILDERIESMRRDFIFQNELNAIDMEMQGRTASHIRLELELAQERQALTLRHLEEDLEVLKARYAKSELRAPFDGTITYLADYSYGSWVAPFADILYIAPKDAALFVECTERASFGHASGTRVIAHIDGEVFETTRIAIPREQTLRYDIVPIRFSLDSESQPTLGAFASLHVYIRRADDVLRLPRNALFFNPAIGTYVYRVENGQREIVFINVGVRSATYVEVLAGVYEGDEIYVRS